MSRLQGLAGACVLAFMQILSVSAQQTSLELQGYAKQLGIRFTSPLSGHAYWLNVSRLRTQGVLDLGAHVHIEAWLDTEVLTGSYLRSPDYAQAQVAPGPQPFRLDWTLHSGSGYEVRQRLFRAFVQVRSGRATTSMGRQRIAWGSGFAWNPTDILNPFNPGAIELGERAGVDAAHLAVPLGPLSRLELVAAHTATGEPGSFAARAGTNVRSYDLALMAGRFRRDWVIGGDFAGYVRGAGVRGEWAYSRRHAAKNHVRAVLNADYTFQRGIYALGELYFNGRGSARKARYDYDDLRSGHTFSLARWYAAVSAGASVTPLIAVGLYQLLNLTDGSLLIGPSITYSLSQSVEAAAATYVFAGASDSEFGAQRHVYFATVQWYF